MRRREFIALLASAAASPATVRAQQAAKVPRIGILSDERRSRAESFEPFAQGLRELGWVEGQNVAFEHRYAEGKNEILPSLAAELIGLQPDVILAIGTGAARAAKSATQTIPIVFTRVGDPLGSGLVPELARPGGNLTGLSMQYWELDAKRLEFLVTAVPDAKRVGVLWDPSFPTAGAELREFEAAARSLNVELIPVEVRSLDDLESALRAMVKRGAHAMIYVPGPGFISENALQTADLLVKAQLPSMFPRKQFVEAGCLMSYGPDQPGMVRRAAVYVDKILKGAKPADIPVEQPTKFELVINLKTAKSLGLTIPPLLLGRADEVIE
jgi:putative ABC transport system substrate-binding protein